MLAPTSGQLLFSARFGLFVFATRAHTCRERDHAQTVNLKSIQLSKNVSKLEEASRLPTPQGFCALLCSWLILQAGSVRLTWLFNTELNISHKRRGDCAMEAKSFPGNFRACVSRLQLVRLRQASLRCT